VYERFWTWAEGKTGDRFMEGDRLFLTTLFFYLVGWFVSIGIFYHAMGLNGAPVPPRAMLAAFIALFWPVALPAILSVKFFGLFF
jgi:hypothetical protein